MDLLQQLNHLPLALDHEWARRYFAGLTRKQSGRLLDVNGEVLSHEKPTIKALTGGEFSGDSNACYRVINGVAIVPVVGPLAHRFSWWQWGYRELATTLQVAATDKKVSSILLDMETPGGTVAGLWDFCGLIRKIDAEKPVYALINDTAASAGLAISASTRRRFITQQGVTGSLGCVMVHQSYEVMMKEYGVEVTMIYAGAHKVDGNPYKNLPDDVYQALQGECEALRIEFADLVASNTSLSAAELLATEARCYRGQEAIDLGLADEMVNAYEIADLINEQSSSNYVTGIAMSNDTENPAAVAATAERTRMKAIIGHTSAAALSSLANHLAYDTDLGAEASAAILAAAAADMAAKDEALAAKDKELQAAKADKGSLEADLSGVNSGFESAMGKNNPQVSAEGEDLEPELSDEEKEIAAMVSVYKPNKGK